MWEPGHGVQSKDNPADFGTRGVKPAEMGEGSCWQNGPEWLKLNMQHWPIDYHYKEKMPDEEIIQIHKVNAVRIDETVLDIKRFNSYNTLINVTAMILRIARQKSFKLKEITREDVIRAEIYWEKDAMKLTEIAFDKGKLISLRAVKNSDGMIVISGRVGQLLKIGYEKEHLMVLMPQHKYSKLYLKMIHEGEKNLEHNGVLADLSKSRERYWIPQAKRILTRIRFNCFQCRLKNKVLEKQIMAPLPKTR